MSAATFNWEDPLLLDSQLTDDERMVREAAYTYCQEKLAPRVLQAFRHEKMDVSIFPEMGAWACSVQPFRPSTVAQK